jgi:hypothetical protein
MYPRSRDNARTRFHRELHDRFSADADFQPALTIASFSAKGLRFLVSSRAARAQII